MLRPALTRHLLGAPRALYAAHAGWLLGHRFLLLRHRGRRSGRTYATVLEVLSWDAHAREAVVISGLGPRAQWLRNVLVAGAAEIEIGSERFPARVRELGPAEAAEVLADYERRNRFALPVVRRLLARLAGFDYDGSESARRLIATRLPLVAFTAPLARVDLKGVHRAESRRDRALDRVPGGDGLVE
jgi:deazaflavin-dependent oxidoreductase (nitroreductase family)